MASVTIQWISSYDWVLTKCAKNYTDLRITIRIIRRQFAHYCRSLTSILSGWLDLKKKTEFDAYFRAKANAECSCWSITKYLIAKIQIVLRGFVFINLYLSTHSQTSELISQSICVVVRVILFDSKLLFDYKWYSKELCDLGVFPAVVFLLFSRI